ncbi:MAG TPA: hypothetical protein VMH35_24805 [Streptosporangiaceae bacterium]|nr:hypothetical protein [Streptosporangiaceae bacterium]
MSRTEAQHPPSAARVVARPGARLAFQVTGDGASRDDQETRPRPLDALDDLARPVLVAVGERDVPGFRERPAVLARRIPGSLAARHRKLAPAGGSASHVR